MMVGKCRDITLDQLRCRCERIAGRLPTEDDCWLWQHSRNSAGHPTMAFRGKSTLARRTAFILAGGELLKGHVITTCADSGVRCINPRHVEQITYSERLQRCHDAGGHRRNYRTLLDMTIIRGLTKLDREKAQAIRAAKGLRLASELSAEYGVCKDQISRIWCGRAWRDEVEPGSSVFAWAKAA